MITFDFIYSFGQWMIDYLLPILQAETYDPSKGTFYEFIISVSTQYLIYLLFIIATILVIIFVLGFIKSIYYLIREFI